MSPRAILKDSSSLMTNSPPICALVSIGDELLLGLTLDTNAHYLSGKLTALGWRLAGVQIVGDGQADIVRAIRQAQVGSDLVLITGGLGPTEDDRTRAAIAEVLGEPLEERVELREKISAQILAWHAKNAPDKPLATSNFRQAQIPRGADSVENTCGTAPGIHATLSGTTFFSMPGVPREMKEMFTRSVLPAIREKFGTDAIHLRRIHLYGLGESSIGEVIASRMQPGQNPEVGITANESTITIRLLARGETAEVARACSEEVEAEIRNAFPEHIFGYDDEDFPAVIVNCLRKNKETLALAESCTGGMLASLLINTPGASEVFLEGTVTYTDAAKTRVLGVTEELLAAKGAVSEEVVRAMAEGMREKSGADWALAISGIAGPGGGTKERPVGTVCLALCGAKCIVTLVRKFGSDRYGNRIRAAMTSLDLLRREMSGLEIPWEHQRERRR